MRIRKRRFCSGSVIENQYFTRMMPERTSMRSNSGTVWKNSSTSALAAEAHDPLDAGAVVPAPVEQHDLAGGRQVGHVTLEVPLGALALGRRRQRHGAADARVEPLGHALDHAALAGGVATLEQHDHLELAGDHPVLQLDELALQAQQLGEIQAAVDDIRPGNVAQMIGQARHDVVAQFQLELLVEAVGQFLLDAILETLAVLLDAHPQFLHCEASKEQLRYGCVIVAG